MCGNEAQHKYTDVGLDAQHWLLGQYKIYKKGHGVHLLICFDLYMLVNSLIL